MSALLDKIRHAFSRQGVQELINNTEIGDVYNYLTKNSSNSSASGGGVTSFNSNLNHQLSSSDGELDLFPDMESSGLWEMFFAFSTSKYCLFLIIVAFITNRIRHICRPNGRPRPIPSLTRLTILLPSLVSLSYIAFCFLKETTLAYSLESENGGQKKLKDLKVGEGDGTLFWRALLSSGVSIITENLLRNLEARLVNENINMKNSIGHLGMGKGLLSHRTTHFNLLPNLFSVPPNSHTEPSSFNLFSWALLLHQCLSFGPTPSSSSPPSQASSLKSTSLKTSLLARISSSAVRNRSNPFPNYSNTTFLTSRTHLFFHLSIIVLEIGALNILDIFSKRGSKLRLPISSAFAFIGISQYLWNLSRNQRFSFDWSISRFWELVVLALILLTAGLNLLTQLILTSVSTTTEGSNSRHIRNFSPFPLNRFFQLDFSRIFFHPSNFPSLHDDFGTALFKLGASCLKTTRMNGMQVETIEIRTLETSYVEVNWKDGVGDQAQVKGVNQNENGLNNEIKRIQGDGFHNPRKEEEESPWLWETSVFQTLHTSVNRVRAIKDFLTEFYLLVQSFTVFVYQSFMNLSSVRRFLSSDQVYRIRRISNKVFKWCRLLWHGTKGERERELRIKTREMLKLKEEREQKQLKEMIERRRKAREGIINSNVSGYNSIHAINDDDEEDDDWEERDSDEEIEGEGDEEEIERRNRERLFSPTPGPEEFAEEPDSNSLIQLARSDFNSRDAVGTGNAWSRAQGQEVRNRWNNLGSSNPMQSHNQNHQDLNSNDSSDHDNNNFSDIFLAHFSNSNNSPMTRRIYQSRFNQGLDPSSSSASSRLAPTSGLFVNSTSDGSRGGALNQQLTDRNRRMMEEEQKKDLIDVMRARRIPINGNSNASGSLDYEKERMRTCVVCITEERTILLWPCRCLALCEGCRDSLASRPGSNSLTGGSIICPCCRSPIQGYSRLFLP